MLNHPQAVSTRIESVGVLSQEFELPIPAGMPPGSYRIVAGIYESPAGARLPLTFPASQPDDRFDFQDIQIVDGEP